MFATANANKIVVIYLKHKLIAQMEALKEKQETKAAYFTIPMVIYPFDLMVSIGQDNDALKEILDLQKIQYGCYFERKINKGRASLFESECGIKCLIRLRDEAEHSLIAHEVFHIVTLLMDSIGVRFDIGTSDEAYAYLVGYLTEEIYKKLPNPLPKTL